MRKKQAKEKKKKQVMDEEHPDFTSYLKRIARRASKKAIKEAHDAGLAVLIMEKGDFFLYDPDKRMIPVKEGYKLWQQTK